MLAESIIKICKDSNCETDNDVPFVPVKLLNSCVPSSSFDSSINLVIDESGFIDIDDLVKKVDVSVQEKTFVENPAAFIGGYLARFLLHSNKSICKNCEVCRALLTQEKKLTTQTIFLECKSFDFVKLGLTYPSEDLIKTVSEFGYAFPNLSQTFASKPSINLAIAANLHNIEHSWFSCSSHEELG